MKQESDMQETTLDLTEEEFFKMLEKTQSSEDSSFEDPALQKFIKEPEPNLHNEESKLTPLGFFLLLFSFLVILISSIIGKIRGSIETYLAIPIAILSLFGLLTLISNLIINKKSK